MTKASIAALQRTFNRPMRPSPNRNYRTPQNQLDLFGNLPPDAANDPPVAIDPSLLGELPAFLGRGASEPPPAGVLPFGSGDADRGAPPTIADSTPPELPDSVGAGDAGLAPERGPPVERERPSRDFRITPAHGIGEGSLHEKARHNLAAIRTLKQIEAEDRLATDDAKAVLARYAGWGAMANAFNSYYAPSEWKATAKELQSLLTDEEYEAARASTPNAHFTSPMVITAMWRAMERLGFEGGYVLEPSMGVGHFLGLMPEMKVQRTGVELDSITARIAQKLYPDAKIFAKGFEDTALPDDYFDCVIGNIPFGNYAVHDPAYKPALTRAVHDYFLAKSINKLRPGGVMAVITSRYTMDKQGDSVRRHLSGRADLVGAIRLPNTAFKENAGTEVTTDILFLQKRLPGTLAHAEPWRELGIVHSGDDAIAINEYFVRHPEIILGEIGLQGSMYRGQEITVEGELSPAILSAAVSRLPAGIMGARGDRAEPKRIDADDPAILAVKDGAFAVHEGQIVIRQGSGFEPLQLSASVATRVRGMMTVRDSIREVFRTQLDDAEDDTIRKARDALNHAYDRFTRQHGPMHSRDNIRAYAGDPDHPLLLSLETYDPETKRANKTAIFERRTLERYKPVERVETASEALTVSLNETGGIHWPRMEQLTGRDAAALQFELGSLAYANPSGEWEPADRYLSGDVRAKLKIAEQAAELDPAYARNVDALKAVQPTDLAPGEIEARLGASWIPASDMRDFTADLLQTSRHNIKVAHAGAIATWSLEADWSVRHEVANTTTHGSARFKASELIEQALNAKTPTAYDEMPDGSRVVNQQETLAAREKQQQIKDRFREWVWNDPERATRLARDYNDKFNNIRLRTFDGSHLTLPGMNRSVLRTGDLDKHQRDGVWRILQSPTTLLAHVVGSGKSYLMSSACMELRRLGLAKKPMIIVPNHLAEQMGSEFLRLYPTANVFIAGKDHFSGGNRQKAMARIATGNYDAVIVSHKSFELLPVSDATFKRFMDDQIDQLEDAILEAKAQSGDTRRIVKELEKAKKRFTAKIKDRADRENKDNTLTFEELGVDYLFVDEADLFKNLFFVTKMSRIAGLPNSDSNRSFDMFIKTRYVRQVNEGRGVVFATGTPISNTMAEMFTMQRYLGPEMLEERGVQHFDAWAANFGEAVTALELSPDGNGYRMHTRFAKFINLPELLTMFRSVADVQTADMLNLPRPSLEGGRPRGEAAPASPDLKAFVGTLVKRAERLRMGGVDPKVDNMLKITGEGRKAALDMRLVVPEADCSGDTKLARAVNRIHETWQRTNDTRLTQMVFCDLSTPSTDKFNVYHEVRDRLVGRGVPESDIAFIHDAETDAAKKALFDSVNSGRTRILMGSTEKMGAGTNVQRKLKALHHLDAPWRPRDIEQREGRILRQGNLNPEVQIYRYVTEGSFDAYMWQTLETKARFIQQVMNGSVTVRQAEDLEGGALTYAEIKAIASGNPAVMEKVKVDTEIRKLDQLRSAHRNQQHSIRMQAQGLPNKIGRTQEALEKTEIDLATRNANARDEFTMTVGRKVFSGKGAREEAAKALTDTVLSWRNDHSLQSRGFFRGFEILSRGRGTSQLSVGDDDLLPDIYVQGAGLYKARLNPTNPVGTVQSIEATLRSFERFAEEDREEVAQLQKRLADLQGQGNRPFEHEDRLKDLLAKQAQLNAALDLDKSDRQAAEIDDEPVARPAPSFVERVIAERHEAQDRGPP